MERAKNQVSELLKQCGYSVTSPRIEIFELLYKYGLQTMSQLVARSTANRASVYRSVDVLKMIGVLRYVQYGFKYKLELSDSFLPHHHHLVCVDCGKSTDISNDTLEQLLHDIAKNEGYVMESHTVELSGYCQQCALKR